MEISKKQINIIAALLLGLMFVLMITSSWNDSAIVDEVPHIGAGYSYITQKDMRLNPEHPPLIKDLAAFPLLFLNLKFPGNHQSWQKDINGQWDFGAQFIHKTGNPTDQILLFSRLPVMILTIILGWFVFKWTRELFGDKAGLIALFLYSLSPTIITHGRFVTTDLGAAAGVFIATYYFVKFLFEQNTPPHLNNNFSFKKRIIWLFRCGGKKNIIVAGITFGLAELAKFSVFLLIPFFGLLTIIYLCVFKKEGWFKLIFTTFKNIILMFLIGAGVIWIFYLYHTWNYPAEPENIADKNRILEVNNCDLYQDVKTMGPSQFKDAVCILKSFGKGQKDLKTACTDLKYLRRCPAELVIWASNKPIIRPLAQYLFGFLMVVQRSIGGNTAYFLGEVSATGSRIYFPIVYLIKETITLHILTAIAIGIWLFEIKRKFSRGFLLDQSLPKPSQKAATEFSNIKNLKIFLKNHFSEFAMLVFIAIYWFTSIRSNLNIGVRHLLPILPLTFVLVAGQISKLIHKPEEKEFCPPCHAYRQAGPQYDKKTIFEIILALLLIFQFISVTRVWPSFLAYFNEAVGGYKKGYLYVTDSNLDWGQDLKRLKKFTEKNNIQKINLDYFGGGGGPEYYLKEKFNPWWSARGKPAEGEWFAISATFLQGALGKPAPGFIIKPEDRYDWLKPYQPIEKIGQSIWIFKF